MYNADIKSFISTIVQSEYPAESEVFNSFHDLFAEKIEEGNDINELVQGTGAHNEFMEIVTPIVSSLGLLAGTIKTIIEVKQLVKKKKKTNESIQNVWKTKLMAEGLTSTESDKIVNKYISDLLNRI